MRRIDLRHLKNDFINQMSPFMQECKSGEVLIFLFEIGDDLSLVDSAVEYVLNNNFDLMNSLKFNQVDWSIVVKKVGQNGV